MRRRHGELVEPVELVKASFCALPRAKLERVERHAKARDRVAQGSEGSPRARGHAVPACGAKCPSLGRFFRTERHVRENVEARPARRVVGLANDEHAVAPSHDRCRDAYGRRSFTRWDLGQSANAALLEPPALAPERTPGAVGVARRAERRAELHQRLIEVARAAFRDELGRDLPEPHAERCATRITSQREEPRENANDVPVDDRHPFAERDARHRSRGVCAHPRQSEQRLVIGWHASLVPLVHRLRRLVQAPRSGVVAEPLPGVEHVRLASPGERSDGREASQKVRVPTDHGLHLRLLQHDLAHPDRVRIARAPPG